ncbi:MAG: SusC/RagA family TonB-linked outer membrane protein [Flavobacteriaceae bacterium]|nr:SusC/RagA family TonB-linked outer membrane protein [Flavobacteriaceae bacterium]
MKLFLTLLLAFVVQVSFAQEKVITGTVSDESGPLPGVNVVVKGTTKGTQTDFDGKFVLKNVKKGDVIVFSYVGMATVNKKVGNGKVMNVVMKAGNTLEEVVIVGYGTAKKTSLTGSSKSVKADLVQSKATSNISKALAGEVSGVKVVNSSGQPGSSAKVRIRGFSSISGVNDPLYVVDGVPYEGDINGINQSDIETFTVLKDASATAIYGSRGSNGVIVITTKKGKKGTSFIEVETKAGLSMELLPRYDMISTPEEYVEISWDILKRNLDKNLAEYNLTDAQIRGYASEFLFSDDKNFGKIPNFYNMWNQRGEDLIDPVTGKLKPGITRRYTPEDYDKHLFGIGIRNETTIKLSGGNDKTRYYTSVGYLDDNGYAKKTNFNRISSRLNVNHEVKEWLKGSVNMAFIISKARGAAGLGGRFSANPFYFAKNVAPIYPVYQRDANGNKIAEPYFGGYLYDIGFGANRPSRPFANDTNPLASIEYDYAKDVSYRFVGNQYLEAKLMEGLTLSSRFGLEYLNLNGTARKNPFYGQGVASKGVLTKSNVQLKSYTWTKMLKYEKEFDEHEFNVMIAHENSESEIKTLEAQKSNLVNPFAEDLSSGIKDEGKAASGTDGSSLESYFTQLNYEYSNKYIAQLTFRRDGTSKFSNHKWDNFGSLGLAWRISKEDFLLDSEVFKELKLRTSYGLTGNQGTATEGARVFYANQDIYGIGNVSGNPTINLSLKGNPDLTWETSKMFEVGTDFNIADVLEGSFAYYMKDTDGMFYDQRGGISLGYAFIKVNDGKMRNSGFEFDLKAHVVNTNDFKFDVVLNGEMIKNKITAMPIDPSTGKEVVLNDNLSTGESAYNRYTAEWVGVNKDNGHPQWASYYDDKNNNNKRDDDETIQSMTLYKSQNKNVNIKKDVTDKYEDATQKYVNKFSVPDVRGAFAIYLDYKGISFSTQFLYGIGGYVYDGEYAGYMSDNNIGQGNYHIDVRNRWQNKGDITDVPRFTAGLDQGGASTRFLTKMDYLTLNNVKLGYTLPKNYIKTLGVEKLSFFVSGDNLWVASHRKGLNPTTDGDNNTTTYNPLSTITLGVNVKF